MFTHSPWLDFERTEWPGLKADLACEVAIVGAGISGIATLYYLMTSTEKNVVLIEKNRVASGATGHNAGLAVVFMEKSAAELVEMIGKEATHAIFDELDEAWDELHTIHQKIGLKDNLLPFPHIANGYNSLPKYVSFLRDVAIRNDYIPTQWRHLVSDTLRDDIPEEFSAMVEFVPHREILTTLKTIDTSYIAATTRTTPFKGKRMNSAKFCYAVLAYLKENFAHRFTVYEQTDISKIDLYDDHSVLKHAQGSVTAQEVILCTNAYKHFSIWDQVNDKPFTKLEESITPRIGFLAAFPATTSESYALGLFNQKGVFNEIPIWYFSQAPHNNHNPDHACVIGGPEFDLDDSYSPKWVEIKGALSLDLTQQFLKMTFKEAPASFPYFWYGLMGYTEDGLRWVGPDSDHPHLWYNLACNGIGIVHAIAGGKKIASQI